MSELKSWFNVSSKIAKSTDPNSDRYANVHACPADADNVYLTATDGKHAAVNRVEGTLDKPRLAPALVVTHTGKRPMRVECNSQWQNDKGKFAPVVTDGRFPLVPDVLPSPVQGEHTLLILDAGVLKRLADSVSGYGIVRLFLPPAEANGKIAKAIAVSGSDGIGAIMPCYDTGDAADYFRDYQSQRDTYCDTFAQVEHD